MWAPGSVQPSIVGPALSRSGSTVYALVVPLDSPFDADRGEGVGVPDRVALA